VADANYGKYKHDVTIFGTVPVKFGEPVGKMGESGFAFGYHTHFQVNVSVLGGDYVPENPLGFYAKVSVKPFTSLLQ